MTNKRNITYKIIHTICMTITVAIIIHCVRIFSVTTQLFENIEVAIIGNKYVDNSTIENRLYPYLTQSLFTLKLNEIKDAIISIDFIESIQISSILPNTLVINVIENKPILLLNNAENIFFIDERGALLPANTKSIMFFPVPLISVLDTNSSITHLTENIIDFFQYIFDDYHLFYTNLSEVIIDEKKWTLYTDKQTRVFVTSNKLLMQIEILKNFENTIYPMKTLADYLYIDLRTENQIVVKEINNKG